MIRRRRFKFQVGFAALLVMCFFSWRRDDAISEIAEKSVKVVEEVSGTYVQNITTNEERHARSVIVG